MVETPSQNGDSGRESLSEYFVNPPCEVTGNRLLFGQSRFQPGIRVALLFQQGNHGLFVKVLHVFHLELGLQRIPIGLDRVGLYPR